MPGFVISDTNDPCGTSTNWYIEGPFNPMENMVEDVTFCRNDGPTCTNSENGKVKKCDEMNYVFKLPQTYTCPGAYCIKPLPGVIADGKPPDISSIKPVITTDIEMYSENKGGHIHHCDFLPIADKTVWYSVGWSLSTGVSLARHLYTAPDTQYTDKRTFRLKTGLTEDKLKINGVKTMGYRIACVVTAKSNPASAFSSETKSSKSKYCGIEVVTKQTIVLDDLESKPFEIMLTVPFACEKNKPNCNLDVDMYIPDNVNECKVSSLTQQRGSTSLPCGIQFTNNDVGKVKQLTVQNVLGTLNDNRIRAFDVLLRVKFFSFHDLMSKYYLDPIKVRTAIDTQPMNGKECHAVCDPHMRTFDGQKYENQNEGIFVMYRNKRKNVEVQIKTDKCSNYHASRNGPWCVVGVATRAGRDIFVTDLSENYVGFKSCESRILEEKITKNGQSYKVYLPTGAEVNIQHTWQRFFNVYITPSLEDWENTEGLCGRFDGNRGNDNTNYAYPCSDRRQCWRVNDAQNLFKATPNNLKDFDVWSEDVQLCSCRKDPTDANSGTNALDTHVVCTADSKKTCIDDSLHRYDNTVCSLKDRRKRDVHLTTQTDFDHQHEVDVTDAVALRMRRSSSVVYNETTAREACTKAMNTSAVQKCSGLPGLDITSSFDNCVLDTMFSNSLEWAQVHIESIKTSCLKYVEFNQPIPEEIVSQLKVPSANETDNGSVNDNVTTAFTFPPTLPTIQPLFTDNFLRELKDISCTNDCSGNGKCIKGECRCNPGYFELDCSINIHDAPEVVGIPDKGKCDVSERQCAQTSILGRRFVENENLTCRSRPFKVDINNNLKNGTTTTSHGRLQSFVEVVCQLPQKKQKRSVTDNPEDDYLASGYRVSVSNNGEQYSKEDTLIIFDSTCVSCNKTRGVIVCSAKEAFCMQGGRCYRPGDIYGCYICKIGAGKNAEWSPGKECEQKIPSQDNVKSKLWIIGATIAPVVVVVVVLFVAMRFCLSKQRARERKVVGNPIYNVPARDINTKKMLGHYSYAE